MADEKNENKKSKYGVNRDNGWLRIASEELDSVQNYAEEYRRFLSEAKTERLFYKKAVELAAVKGFKNLDGCISLRPGDAVYLGKSGRTLLLARIGTKDLQEGLNIVGGHIDSPRLDIKPNPLYEDGELALLDTHYYGGIKKYQWVTIPLAMHGHIIREDGTAVSFAVGEDPSDPVFTITDLLPHLGKDQGAKPLSEAITGEGLNVLTGSRPLKDSEVPQKVKESILSILNERYGITEEDFNSADIQFVPAGPARDLGLDRSMILGYGHDDRICSYAALRAILDMDAVPEYTSVVLLCDKEEIGSYGATGMESFFFENAIAEIMERITPDFLYVAIKRALANSRMLSADVNSLHDPNYPEVSAPNNNMPTMNRGTIIQKYTGARGKAGASEASPEFVAQVRRIFNRNAVLWQTGELGKVDMGGGGTIAYYMARYGMDVIDCGPGLLSMHAPHEVAGKLDAYMTWKGYLAFLKEAR